MVLRSLQEYGFSCTANLWIALHSLIRGRNSRAASVITTSQLKSLMSNLDQLLKRRDADILSLSDVVRQSRRNKQSLQNPTVQRSLKRILALKKSRESILHHMQTLENQLDAIESSAYNTQLVKTMQQSANTMRQMGLSQNLKDADAAMKLLDDNLYTASEISHVLSVPLSDSINDDDLAAEFENIFSAEEIVHDSTQIQTPAMVTTQNHMEENTEPITMDPTILHNMNSELPEQDTEKSLISVAT